MKKNAKRILLCVLFLILLAVSLLAAFRLTERKDSMEMNEEFIRDGANADVLFAGSSHVVDGISPAVLWNTYGISSYNIGGHGSNIETTYWTLVNALDYCTPKVVLIDTFMLERNYQYLDVLDESYDDAARESAVSQLHTILDAYPLSRHKVEAVRDLIRDPMTRLEFYFDFIRYHGRWSELTQKDYEEYDGRNLSDTILGSEELFTTDTEVTEIAELPEEDVLTEDTRSKDYLRKIIELCEGKGIQVILIHVPFPEEETYQRASNSGSLIAAEYGIPFINLNRVEGLIDPDTDMADQSHLNALGSYKVSLYLGAILSQNGIADHRGEAGYESYEEASSKLREEVLSNVRVPKDLSSLISTLELPYTSSVLLIRSGSPALRDESLLKEISDFSQSDAVYFAAENGAPYFLVRDNLTGKILESADGSAIEKEETGFGVLSFYAPDPLYDLMMLGDSEDNHLDFENHRDVDAEVLVYDNQTGEEIVHLFFKEGLLLTE